MITKKVTIADISALTAVKLTIVVTSMFTLGACSESKEAGQTEIQQVIHLSPENKHSYIDVNPEILVSLKDPVCGMSVKNKVMDTLTHEHQLYGFCGTGCKEAFLKEPMQYKPEIGEENKK